MGKETILLLDPEIHTQKTIAALLENEKYIVITVNNIDRAKKNFKEFEISALITEYWVDKGCTVDHIQELKRSSPELYIMMLTNRDVGDSEYRRITNAGVDDLFLKPFSGEKILLHLKKGLRQRKLILHKKKMEKELNQNKVKVNNINMTPESQKLSVQ